MFSHSFITNHDFYPKMESSMFNFYGCSGLANVYMTLSMSKLDKRKVLGEINIKTFISPLSTC